MNYQNISIIDIEGEVIWDRPLRDTFLAAHAAISHAPIITSDRRAALDLSGDDSDDKVRFYLHQEVTRAYFVSAGITPVFGFFASNNPFILDHQPIGMGVKVGWGDPAEVIVSLDGN